MSAPRSPRRGRPDNPEVLSNSGNASMKCMERRSSPAVVRLGPGGQETRGSRMGQILTMAWLISTGSAHRRMMPQGSTELMA
jgi:hypothetical protein